ncbi:MAG: 50S ribosomal protein L32 [Tenericutes bacterium]|nr:MAG: 50S ribosomal protein L32 [Mycoplasmatota bacterium]
MAVGPRRLSRHRQAKRRTHQKLSKPESVLCTNCGAVAKPHNVCTSCGFYKGKEVIKINEK